MDRDEAGREAAARSGRQEFTVPRSVVALYKEQGSLPRLPVPDLYVTCMKYLRSVKPLLSDEQFAKTSDAVIEFALKDGPRLQQRLHKRAKSLPDSSWLIDWWNDIAYLTDPEPVVFFVSYFYSFKEIAPLLRPPVSPHRAQCAVAAALVVEALSFRDMIMDESLTPDRAGGRATCSSQYAFLFNSCRIPAYPPQDRVATYPLRCNPHIIVLHKRRIVSLDVAGMNINQVEEALAHIVQDVDARGVDEWGVGALTSDERFEWGRARKALMETDVNAHALDEIQRAALAVCLDDTAGEAGVAGLDARARACWHGDGRNRFYDKTLQFIVDASGRAGFLGEHAIADGSPSARMCDWMLTRIRKGTTAQRVSGHGGGRMKVLDFKLTIPLKRAIKSAETKFDGTVRDHQLSVLSVPTGRDAIKSVGVAPDAFVQMSLQLAFFRLSGGRCAATYEASSTRAFLHGRTETIRSCSIESKKLCEAMSDGKATDKDRYAALLAAIDAHRAYSAMCSRAQGVDRHLLGLKRALEPGEPVPAIFGDPAYDFTRTWELSTSTLSSEMFESWGFGEVCEHGFGVGYTLNKNELSFVIVCRNEPKCGAGSGPSRAKHFGKELFESLKSLHDLCAKMKKPAAKL